MVQLVFPNVYHPLDNAIQLLNNWGYLISGYCTRVLQHLSNLIALPNQVQTFDSDIFVLCLRSAPWISYFLLRAQSCCPILGLLTEGVVIVFTAEPFCLLRSSDEPQKGQNGCHKFQSTLLKLIYQCCVYVFYIVNQLGRCMFFACKLQL